MPGLALSPAINQISTTAFPDIPLGSIQTVLALASFTQPLSAVIAAFLINRRVVTKKIAIIFGLCLYVLNAVLAILFHTEFWHLIMLSIVLGISTGCVHPNMFGLLFDNFEVGERQVITGYQSALLNAGVISMSLVVGLLATFIWYGGYLVLFVGLPAVFLVLFAVPNYWAPVTGRQKKKASGKLNPKIFYYCAIAFLFMMVYTVGGQNLSTHMKDLGDSSTAGIGIALLMAGGVISGLFLNKLSILTGDYTLSFAMGALFIGFMMLSLFPGSLIMVFIAVFIAGSSLSIALPRCIFMVSTLATDQSSSQTATALVSTVTPALGGFMSPVVFTNITTALYGDSTVARYMFVSIVVLVMAIIVALITFLSGRKRARAVP